tara:strand:+ start:1068 stop:1580 length:513 start_codon:yes stop_codon:yes gene_type:complete
MFFGSLIAAINKLVIAVLDLTSAMTVHVNQTRVLISVNKGLAENVRDLRKVIGLRTPGLVWLKLVKKLENGMAQYALVLPTPGASDVVVRELVISVNGAESVTQTLQGQPLESEPFDANEDDIISGSLTDIDDATPANRSEPRLYELVVPDQTAPPQPGEVGLRKIEVAA